MATKPKTSTKHPYAAIEHRVIDSLAYADLTYSARALLTIMTRQLTKDNNGHLQATHTYLKRFGFSENTVTRGIAELISHGMICRTRSGGYQQGAAKYAVTWLSISKREGIFLAGFKSCAWREWQPADKKTPPPKMMDTHLKNGEWTPPTTPKSAAGSTPKLGDIEYVPCRGSNCSPESNGLAGEVDQAEQGGDEDTQDGFTRCRDDAPVDYWDGVTGESRSPKAKQTLSGEEQDKFYDSVTA